MKLAPGIFKEFLSLRSKAVLEVMGLGGGNAPHVLLLVYILTIYLINCIIHSQCIFFQMTISMDCQMNTLASHTVKHVEVVFVLLLTHLN